MANSYKARYFPLVKGSAEYVVRDIMLDPTRPVLEQAMPGSNRRLDDSLNVARWEQGSKVVSLDLHFLTQRRDDFPMPNMHCPVATGDFVAVASWGSMGSADHGVLDYDRVLTREVLEAHLEAWGLAMFKHQRRFSAVADAVNALIESGMHARARELVASEKAKIPEKPRLATAFATLVRPRDDGHGDDAQA